MTALTDIPLGRDAATWAAPPHPGSTLICRGLVHRVERVRGWRNVHTALFTDWRGVCGTEATTAGSTSLGTVTFGRRYWYSRGSLCPDCWGRR